MGLACGAVGDAGQTDAIDATERWFLAQGVPHFIFRYSSSRGVFARLLPLVGVVFAVEVILTAPNRRYPLAGSLAAVVGGLAVLVGMWAIANRVRGRPALALPDRIGVVEVFVFALGPALVPLTFGGQWRSALTTAGVNLALLGGVALVTSYGLVPMTTWALSHGIQRLRTVTGLLVRALPLVFLIVIVVFVNTEAWQVASELHWPVLLVVAALFFLVGALFAVIRVAGQIGEVEADTWPERRALAASTPAAPLVDDLPDEPGEPPPLSNHEWRNVQLVVLVSEGILVVIVGAAMFAFFVVLGVLAITPAVIQSWIGHRPDVLFSFDLFGEHLVLSSELLKVCGFLAAFSALQFTVSLVSSGEQQEEFLHQLRDELREALAVRAVYLEVRIQGLGAPDPTTLPST